MQPISLSLSFPSGHQVRLEASRMSRRASRVLSRNRALLLKALPVAGGYAFGDCLTQQLGPLWPTSEWPSKHNLAKHDLNKTALMALVGGAVGAPTSVGMYALMNSIAPGSGFALMAAKFAADQVVGCILWQAAYMCISEPYRRTFREFAAQQWQQHQQQCTGTTPAAHVGVGHTVAAC